MSRASPLVNEFLVTVMSAAALRADSEVKMIVTLQKRAIRCAWASKGQRGYLKRLQRFSAIFARLAER